MPEKYIEAGGQVISGEPEFFFLKTTKFKFGR
jgi:hypothetical protein